MKRRSFSNALVALAVLSGTACERQSQVRPFVVRDSGGVRLAVSTAPVWQEPNDAWALSFEPVPAERATAWASSKD